MNTVVLTAEQMNSPLEDFLSKPNAANLQTVGDRCFGKNLLEAAKVLFTALSNWVR